MFDRPKLRELLKIPAGESIFLIVSVGYPAKEGARPKARKTVEEILTFV
jgi:nitroreductase